jgi:hypothetical protein
VDTPESALFANVNSTNHDGSRSAIKATEEFSRCERFESTEHGLKFNWYFSYEGYLAHNQDALKKAKSNFMISDISGPSHDHLP